MNSPYVSLHTREIAVHPVFKAKTSSHRQYIPKAIYKQPNLEFGNLTELKLKTGVWEGSYLTYTLTRVFASRHITHFRVPSKIPDNVEES
jgi:hypothetical protein